MNQYDKPLIHPVSDQSWSAKESWRLFRIMAEFVEGTERLETIQPAVGIFGSARTLPNSPHYQLAEQLARALSDAGFAVISGGGPGIMEAANKGAYFGSSPSIGLNIQLPHEQHGNAYQDIGQTFKHFFTRKYMFVKFSTAYVVMPGGFGTMDELMEALTLVQTGKTRKMPIILVYSQFWRGLVDWFKQTMVAEGFISPEDMNLIQMIDEPNEVVDAIFKHYETSGFELTAAERESQLNL